MKITKPLLLLLLVVATVGCKEKKESTVIIAPKVETQKPQGPGSMQESNTDSNVKWLGKNYKVSVQRVVDKSLPLAKDETGRDYYDNTISVKVTREDRTVFFSRTFKKADFADFLTDDVSKEGALLGIVLDRAEDNSLYFAASVGSPDVLSDSYIPLVLTITNMGAVNVQRDTQLDTAKQPDEQEDDGV